MKNKRYTLYAFLAVVVLGGLCWVVLRGPTKPPEPVYQGKRLSEWLDVLGALPHSNAERASREAAATALRQMGTNAIPSLLWMARARDSELRRRFIDLAGKQKLVKIKMQE